MNHLRGLLACFLVFLLTVSSLAQSGRRPVYPGQTGSATTDKSGAASTGNGTCPVVRFPGEYDGTPTRTASVTSSSNSSSTDPNA